MLRTPHRKVLRACFVQRLLLIERYPCLNMVCNKSRYPSWKTCSPLLIPKLHIRFKRRLSSLRIDVIPAVGLQPCLCMGLYVEFQLVKIRHVFAIIPMNITIFIMACTVIFCSNRTQMSSFLSL
ncbi:hypothetical protein AHF37_10304 [Paragonimus kellicotti]|nr:hypothetical protein AHF37_10304 [Paragonimus kellicotti]